MIAEADAVRDELGTFTDGVRTRLDQTSPT
jgi:hypothetical protein